MGLITTILGKLSGYTAEEILTKGQKILEDVSKSEDLQVVMIGTSGIGKTSLLAGMYKHFDLNSIYGANLKPADDEIANDLKAKLRSLENASETTDNSNGIVGTSAERKYIFDFGLVREKPRFQIVFIDYPGEYFSIKKAKVKEYIETCDVIMITVHSPALMEKDPHYSLEINQSEQVKQFLKTELKESPKLILFVPMKCESYMDNPKNSQRLNDAIQEEYAELLQYLKNNFSDQIAVAITPVQTMGNMRFQSWTHDSGKKPIAEFHRNGVDKYAPKDLEQPLFYSLNFMINQHLDNRHGVKKVFEYMLGKDKPLRDAIFAISEKIKHSENGFSILQGHKLLGIGGRK